MLELVNGLFRQPIVRRKLVVVGAGARSGAGLFCDLLGSMPGIEGQASLLRGQSRLAFHRIKKASLASRRPAFAVTYLLGQAPGDQAAFFRKLQFEGFRFVYVRRENLLRQSLSLLLFNQGYTAGSTTRIDASSVVDQMLRLDFSRGRIETLLKEFEHELVGYEEDLETPDRQASAVKRVVHNLGFTFAAPKITSKRQLPDDLHSAVENLDEIEDRIGGTILGAYLT